MTGDEVLRIVIADDQTSVREALAVMLDLVDGIEVVGTAADGAETLELVEALRPAAVLVDLHMPVLDGVETTRRLRRDHPDVAVVILTTYSDEGSVRDAIGAGATGYLTKNAGRADIVRALSGAVHGQSVMASEVHATLLRNLAASPGRPPPAGPLPADLTAREAEVLVLIAEGYSNGEIAAALYLSHHTVKTHITRIFAKTGSRDRTQAVLFAREHDLAGSSWARRPPDQI